MIEAVSSGVPVGAALRKAHAAEGAAADVAACNCATFTASVAATPGARLTMRRRLLVVPIETVLAAVASEP